MLAKLSKKIAGIIPVWLILLTLPVMGATVAFFTAFTISNVEVDKWYEITEEPKVQRWDGSNWVDINPEEDIIYGGDTIRVVYTIENRANNPVNAIHKIIITEENGPADSDDIDVVVFKYDAVQEEDISETQAIDGNSISYTTSEYTHSALGSAEAYFEITFDPFFEPQHVDFEVQLVNPSVVE